MMLGHSMTNTSTVPGRAPRHIFFATMALLFAASTAVTIVWRTSMAAMGGTTMPGGWSMSMAWMRMAGQTWLSATASFLGMWLAMMVTMMLPSLVPMLLRYRAALGNSCKKPLGRLTTLVGIAYFLVWCAFGLAAYPVGVALAAIEMRFPILSRSVPIAIAAVVMVAGAVQFTGWKTHQLASCREAPGYGRALRANDSTALRHGVRLGLRCCLCCANLTAILMVIGVMDLPTMAGLTAAITIERLAPRSARAARAIGVVVLVVGMIMGVQAVCFPGR